MDIDKKVDNYSDQIVAALEKNPDQVCFDDEDGVCLKVIEKFNLEKKLNGDAPPGITWQDLFLKRIIKLTIRLKLKCLRQLKLYMKILVLSLNE